MQTDLLTLYFSFSFLTKNADLLTSSIFLSCFFCFHIPSIPFSVQVSARWIAFGWLDFRHRRSQCTLIKPTFCLSALSFSPSFFPSFSFFLFVFVCCDFLFNWFVDFCVYPVSFTSFYFSLYSNTDNVFCFSFYFCILCLTKICYQLKTFHIRYIIDPASFLCWAFRRKVFALVISFYFFEYKFVLSYVIK